MITQTLVLQVHTFLHKQELKINECIRAAGSGSRSFNMHVEDAETVSNESPAKRTKATSEFFFPAIISAFLDDSLQPKLLHVS